MNWQKQLQELIRAGNFRTQGQLVTALHSQHGHRVNQASVSRELSRLGARKRNGAYRLPSSPVAGANIYDMKSTPDGNLVVIHTDSAFASVVADTIDCAKLPSVLGTIAGDDTIFVATLSADARLELSELFGLDPSLSL